MQALSGAVAGDEFPRVGPAENKLTMMAYPTLAPSLSATRPAASDPKAPSRPRRYICVSIQRCRSRKYCDGCDTDDFLGAGNAAASKAASASEIRAAVVAKYARPAASTP